MAFDSADAYDRFMGRFSGPLAPKFIEMARVQPGARVLDVGCGPGMLTTELVARLGPDAVSAVDPSGPFVEAARERLPGVDIRLGSAEALPYDDGAFDAALAQLVVHFMAEPVGGLREMARVTRPGGVVAACVWDHASGGGPLSHFWSAVRTFDPRAADESALPGTRAGSLRELFEQAGLSDVEDTRLEVAAAFETFEEWWEPYTLGVGPPGDYVASLEPDEVSQLSEACRRALPDAPFQLAASAWAVRGSA